MNLLSYRKGAALLGITAGALQQAAKAGHVAQFREPGRNGKLGFSPHLLKIWHYGKTKKPESDLAYKTVRHIWQGYSIKLDTEAMKNPDATKEYMWDFVWGCIAGFWRDVRALPDATKYGFSETVYFVEHELVLGIGDRANVDARLLNSVFTYLSLHGHLAGVLSEGYDDFIAANRHGMSDEQVQEIKIQVPFKMFERNLAIFLDDQTKTAP